MEWNGMYPIQRNGPNMTTNDDQIRALLANYEQSLNTSDAALAASCYTPDGIFMPTTLPTAKGADMRGAHQQIFDAIHLDVTFTIDELETRDRYALCRHHRAPQHGPQEAVLDLRAALKTRTGSRPAHCRRSPSIAPGRPRETARTPTTVTEGLDELQRRPRPGSPGVCGSHLRPRGGEVCVPDPAVGASARYRARCSRSASSSSLAS